MAAHEEAEVPTVSADPATAAVPSAGVATPAAVAITPATTSSSTPAIGGLAGQEPLATETGDDQAGGEVTTKARKRKRKRRLGIIRCSILRRRTRTPVLKIGRLLCGME